MAPDKSELKSSSEAVYSSATRAFSNNLPFATEDPQDQQPEEATCAAPTGVSS